MSRATSPRFSGIGGHPSHKSGTVEWLTPPSIIDALGPFDLDPCAPLVQPYPTARQILTLRENGLIQKWEGRIWLNPPYANGVIAKFLARMADHNHGTALIFARTDTEAFHRHVFERASALLFMAGRINFHLPDGTMAPGNAGAPTVLCAYGAEDTDILAACEIAGQFVPLRIPRSVLVSIFATNKLGEKIDTWAKALEQFFVERDGPVALDELYRHFAGHRKAITNQNYQAKLRQQLQRGRYRNVGRGLWDKAEAGDAA